MTPDRQALHSSSSRLRFAHRARTTVTLEAFMVTGGLGHSVDGGGRTGMRGRRSAQPRARASPSTPSSHCLEMNCLI